MKYDKWQMELGEHRSKYYWFGYFVSAQVSLDEDLTDEQKEEIKAMLKKIILEEKQNVSANTS